MNFYQYFINERLQDITLQFEYLIKFAVKIGTNFSELTTGWKSPIEFTSLQWALFKLFFVLLLLTSIIIIYSWKVYGKVITDKFVRPSTLKEIEELKHSVAKLKLPKEHSPRI